MRMLREAVAAEMAKGGFDDVFSEPLVVYAIRGSPVTTLWNQSTLRVTIGPLPGPHFKPTVQRSGTRFIGLGVH